MNKKIIIGLGIILIILVAFFIIKGMFNHEEQNKNNANQTVNTTQGAETITQTDSNEEGTDMYRTGKHHAQIEIKNYGSIALELDADVAPITVANFAKLVNEGFYN